jgi:hypothetical protein
MIMFFAAFPTSNLGQRHALHQARANEEEDENIARFCALTAMARSVDEAMRRADAMIRLELSLYVAPVRSAVQAVAFPHWAERS